MALALFQEWRAAGPASSGAWQGWLADAALAALLAGYGVLLVRALLRRRWYRATDVLGEADVSALRAELTGAEKRTVGEILVVVLERSDRHPGACWLAALVCMLIGTVGANAWLSWSQPALVLAAQLAFGALGYASARGLADFQHFFLGKHQAREAAEEQAFQEFHRYELFRTEARTGVLLFVSLLERHAIVLADEGIAARVEPEHWTRTNELVLEGIRRGSLRDGLLAGIRSAGEVLAQHFPVTSGDRNELPDRVIVRRD
jgi:putative membrane protein